MNYIQIGFVTLALLIMLGLLVHARGEIPDREPTYAWAWTPQHGYFKVYYASVDSIAEVCPSIPKDAIGCAFMMFDQRFVALPKGEEFRETPIGCNAYTHEMLHHWGYHEQSMAQFFNCGGPLPMFTNMTLPHTGFWKDVGTLRVLR